MAVAQNDQTIKAMILQRDPFFTRIAFNVPLLTTGSMYSVENLDHYHVNAQHAQETDLLREILALLSQDSDEDYSAIVVEPDTVLGIFHHTGATTYKTRRKLVLALGRLKLRSRVTIVDLVQ